MKTSEKIVDFLRKSFETALYFATMAVKEDFRNYIRQAGPTPSPEAINSTPTQATAEQGKPNSEAQKAKESGQAQAVPGVSNSSEVPNATEIAKRSILILGNGPSLATDLPKIIEEMSEPAPSEPATEKPAQKPAMKPAPKDVMVVNYFAFDERFEVVRPAYYVLSDPVFFRESNQRERVLQLYETIAKKVTWPMTLYVQYYNPEKFDYRAHLPNDNIRIVRFHSQLYYGFRKIRFALFKRGLGSANFGTVVQVGEYIAMLLGYKEIELYGVDHTLFDGLFVDEENHLLRRTSYYYDDKPAEAKPLIHSVPYGPYTMASFLAENATLFRGHELLKEYADHIGVKIINRTKGSLIDAYDRH